MTQSRRRQNEVIHQLFAGKGRHSLQEVSRTVRIGSTTWCESWFAYKTKDSAKTFVCYIARSQRESFLHTFPTSHFFSFLMDGSTDAGNIEDELIAVMYCFVDKEVQEMRYCVRYLSVKEPAKADARGLIACLCDAMKDIGLDNFLDKASVLGFKTSRLSLEVEQMEQQ